MFLSGFTYYNNNKQQKCQMFLVFFFFFDYSVLLTAAIFIIFLTLEILKMKKWFFLTKKSILLYNISISWVGSCSKSCFYPVMPLTQTRSICWWLEDAAAQMHLEAPEPESCNLIWKINPSSFQERVHTIWEIYNAKRNGDLMYGFWYCRNECKGL